MIIKKEAVMRLKILIMVIVFLTALIFGNSVAVRSEVLTDNSIRFSTPSVFKCGENISWGSLPNWIGEGGKCGNGLLYTVVGEVKAVRDGKIKAKIVVPEDNDREWNPYNGETQNIRNNKFEVKFCITTKASARPLWFQAYSKDGKEIGHKCTVTLLPPK
jgi:hypothetical protein